jgi:hypothetical protein
VERGADVVVNFRTSGKDSGQFSAPEGENRMTGPISTKSSKDRTAEQAQAHSDEREYRPATSGPQADILALQQSAGNQAVSQLLESTEGDQKISDMDGQLETASDKDLKPLPSATASVADAKGLPSSVRSFLDNNRGQPLDPSIRTFMEAGFGYDFSPVTIHFGAQAAESSRAVNARAYTVGRDIVFGDGRYAPKTTTGRELLAHELTHTIQQTTRTQKTPPLSPNNTLEAPANTVSRGVARGLSTASIQSSSGIGLARAERSAHYLNDEELALEISAVNDRLLERGNYSGREEDEKYYKELMDVIARPNRAGLEAISSELDRPRSLKGAHYRNDEELAREISAVNDRLFERRSYSGREEYSGRKEDETYYEELMDEITRPNRAGFEAISSELDRPRSLKGSVDPSPKFRKKSTWNCSLRHIRTCSERGGKDGSGGKGNIKSCINIFRILKSRSVSWFADKKS